MKQTAVEWLVDKFSTQGTLHSSDISQAKEMEKEQMIDCYLKADVFPRKYEFEEYYKEIYGK